MVMTIFNGILSCLFQVVDSIVIIIILLYFYLFHSIYSYSVGKVKLMQMLSIDVYPAGRIYSKLA